MQIFCSYTINSHSANLPSPLLMLSNTTLISISMPHKFIPSYFYLNYLLSYYVKYWIIESNHFKPFLPHSIHKLITKIHTIPKIYFGHSDKEISILLIHSHQIVIVVLAIVIFLFDDQREKEISAPD